MQEKGRVYLLLLFIFLLAGMGCNTRSKEEVLLEGRFTEVAHTKLFLFQLLPDSTTLLDSVVTDEKGNFSFLITPLETTFYFLRNKQGNSITLAAGKGDNIKIEGNRKDWGNNYSIIGSPESQVLKEYQLFASKNQHSIDSLSILLKESQSLPEFPEIRKELDSVYRVIYSLHREEVISLLAKHPASLASVIIASRTFGGTPVLTPDNDFQLLSAIDSTLGKKFINNRTYIAFHERINKYRSKKGTRNENKASLAQGTKVPEIILPDAGGKSRKLSSLTGKMTLVYFWTSWNSESREMNQGLSGLYIQFQSRGFEIFGVSLDTDRISWLNAVRQDRISGIQLNDAKGLKSDFALYFKIKKLPATILLDRKGNVISSGLSVPEIKALLLEKL